MYYLGIVSYIYNFSNIVFYLILFIRRFGGKITISTMATYKVIQDIEAEDKFVGPLTLKQFIFAAGGVAFGWLSFLALAKGAVWALAIFVPPMLLGFFLAFPWSKEQPTEVWVLAKLRFRIKPKKRIWNQDGLQELVTITAPKKVEKQLTDNLSQTEVTSRLKALADTIDTRGWAVKNAQVNVAMTEDTSDRLVSPTILPKQINASDQSVPDMMDEGTTVAANFDQMMHASDEIRKEQTLNTMDKVRRGEPANSNDHQKVHFTPPPTPAPLVPPVKTDVDEASLAQQLRERRSTNTGAYGHLRTIGGKPASAQSSKGMTTSATPAIIQGLAQNNDFMVDTVARQANKANHGNEDEVVVSLR